MATVLTHPDAEKDYSKSLFEYPSGSVEIRSPNGETLSVERANFLLDQVKHELMKAMET